MSRLIEICISLWKSIRSPGQSKVFDAWRCPSLPFFLPKYPFVWKRCVISCYSSTYLNYHRNFRLKVQVTISLVSISMGSFFFRRFQHLSVWHGGNREKKYDLMHYFWCAHIWIVVFFIRLNSVELLELSREVECSKQIHKKPKTEI